MKPSSIIAFLVLMQMLLVCSISLAQIDPVCRYDFNNSDLSESTGNYQGGNVDAMINYGCGVGLNSQALEFTGTADTVELDPNIKDLFVGDFTLSFYFWIDPLPGEQYSLFSVESDCRTDSSFTVSYLVNLNEIRVRHARDNAAFVLFGEKLDANRCWHHLVFIKEGDTYRMMLDDVQSQPQLFSEDIPLGSDHKVHIGYSDCNPARESFMNGKVDNIWIYDQAVDLETIAAINQFPDQLTSQDTTIFQGDTYQLKAGASCTSSVSWSPSTGLDDPSVLEPNASPDQTTDYTITFDHGNCTTTDIIRINVINTDDIDCSAILLPTAFTPNGDMVNDQFGISNDFIIDDLSRFEIYDKWGMKLFETNNKFDTWNGLYNGQNLMPGNYVYKIEYSCLGDVYKKTGRFNLLK